MKAITVKNIIQRIFIPLIFLSYGCSESFLDYEQRGVKNISTFYKTDEQAFEALMAAFDQWQSGTGWNYMYTHMALSDECYAGGGLRGDNSGVLEELNEYRFTSTTTAIKDHYSWLYNCIYRSNLIIDNVDPNTDNKVLCVAMAKALRGYAYFFLVNMWGDVPLVLHELSGSEYNQSRTPKEKVFEQIEKDLTEAIDNLPEKSSMPQDYKNLITKGTAQAMLGKTYLFERKYAEAASVLEQIIKSGEYGLYPDYSKVLRLESEYGIESLWEIPYVTTMNYQWPMGESAFGMWSIMLAPRPEYLDVKVFTNLDLMAYGWGFINPHKELFDAYTQAGDIIRRNANIISPDSLETLGGSYKTIAGHIPYGSDGYIRLRYLPYLSEGSGSDSWSKFCNIGTNCRMIRYADVLLMAAEANNRKSSPDDNKAREYVNQVRNRVNLPDLDLNISGNDLFAAIKLERKLEFAFEGQRFLDLQRWGDAYEALKEQGKSIPDGSGGYLHPDGAGYKQNKNELLPIPEYEIMVNPNMKQNNGY